MHHALVVSTSAHLSANACDCSPYLQHFVNVLSPAKEVPSYLELIMLVFLDAKKAYKVT